MLQFSAYCLLMPILGLIIVVIKSQVASPIVAQLIERCSKIMITYLTLTGTAIHFVVIKTISKTFRIALVE
jgi:hypothetical protein